MCVWVCILQEITTTKNSGLFFFRIVIYSFFYTQNFAWNYLQIDQHGGQKKLSKASSNLENADQDYEKYQFKGEILIKEIS